MSDMNTYRLHLKKTHEGWQEGSEGKDPYHHKLDYLSLTPGTSMVKKRTNSYQLFPHFHRHAVAFMHTCARTSK